MTDRAVKFLEKLEVPTGPMAGQKLRLAPYQKAFLSGSLADGISGAALSVARGGGDAIVLRDPAANMKLAKARSRGRIDPASASVIAVAEGMRIAARPQKKARASWV